MKGEELLQQVFLYAVSATFSYWTSLLLDPKRHASKKALEAKKDIAKRLGRPNLKTNSYEVHAYILHACIQQSSKLFFVILVAEPGFHNKRA